VEKKLTDLVDKALSRRNFLAGAGSVAAGTLIAGCSNSTPAAPTTPPVTTPPVTTPTLTDADYLNFALNLEYLEAEFYLRAATGTGLSSTDAGPNAGAVTGGAKLTGPLTSIQSNYLNEIAQNELDHVRFLRSALGGVAVSRPAIDLTFFGPLAMVAGITTDASFTPFSTYANYLIGAFVFEDVGVTAYHGAALVLTTKSNVTAGAAIHAVEAYHAASIRSQIVAIDALTTPSPGLTAIATKVSALRGTLGGGMETVLSSTSIVASDSNSIGFKRTPDQVLHIVYGGAGTSGVISKGGFFPNGLNGLITATKS
jgi:hypothetical protein